MLGGRLSRILILITMLGVATAVHFPATTSASESEDVPTITKEELKGLLGNPKVVIVDARIDQHWDASEFKIKGAVRGDPLGFLHWVSRYPKDQMLVLYCA